MPFRARRTGSLASIVLLLVLCAASAALAKKKPPSHPINLNTASAAELEQVPGIGPSTAAKILQMRKSYGAFKNVNDLLAVKGIGEKRLEKMRKYLTVNKPPLAPKKSAQPASVAAAPTAKAPAGKNAKTPPSQASEDEEP